MRRRPDRRRARRRRRAPRAPRPGRGAARAAERGVEGDRQGRARGAPGEDRRRGVAEGASSPRSSPSSPTPTTACASSRSRCRTRPTRRCPTAARTTARCCAPSATPTDGAAARPRRVRRRRWASSNTDKAVEMSGSRFAYLMREAVLVELALVQWVMRILVREGFTPVAPPVLVREHAMEEAGLLPHRPQPGLRGRRRRAVPRRHERGAAVGVAPRRDPRRRRPARCATRGSRRTSGARRAPTARTPAASSGCTSSTRSRCSRTADPDESWDEHERILAIEEAIVGGLGLPYRVVNIAAGDLGAAAAKKYDIEVWLPSEGRYRELTSCSNYLDFSARRLGTRLRDEAAEPSWCTR